MIRTADLRGPDADAVAGLVDAYLHQTEREKSERGVATYAGELPEAYRSEVDDPATAYAECTVLVAEIGHEVVGVVVVKTVDADETEIKRLWASPEVRGRGVGSALLDAAIAAAGGPLRLSVWEWRTPVIRLYESRGLRVVPPWDERRGLVCLRHSG